MRVFMLGWEFPPFITGGLGTACHGLTRALDRRGIGVTFVMPGATDPSAASHVDLVSPESIGADDPPADLSTDASAPISHVDETAHTPLPSGAARKPDMEDASPPAGFSPNSEFIRVPVRFVQPYDAAAPDAPVGAAPSGVSSAPVAGGPHTAASASHEEGNPGAPAHEVITGDPPEVLDDTPPSKAQGDYAGDVMTEVRRFAAFARRAAEGRAFDVIHAHDWMTYPAGLEVARRTGRPLVVHVHSTEFDRSGEQVNQQIYDIERRGMHGAMRVITVSQLTRNIVVRRYGVNPDKVTVVYNGVAIDPIAGGARPIGRREKIVLYFGRITRQKGPEYFIRAAGRVLEVEPNVRFIVAGSGDLFQRCIELAAELGIGQHFLFTGFLRGADIEKVFSMADLFVMPSVSEPFGIAPLEAMGHDVPVLISKSSGASEVLTHALKCDFWDTESMADKIVAVLRHPPLGQTLRRHGVIDVRRLTWDDAAAKCGRVYEQLAAAFGVVAVRS